jgi:hypothetical protein
MPNNLIRSIVIRVPAAETYFNLPVNHIINNNSYEDIDRAACDLALSIFNILKEISSIRLDIRRFESITNN